MSEQSLRELAPAGSRWRSKFGGRTQVSTGIYENWRDPREWTEGVTIEPVVGLRSETNSADWGTVRESDLLSGYERIEAEA